MIVRPLPYLVKTAFLACLLYLLPWTYSLPLCLLSTLVYKYILAWICGAHAMPSMDTACFLGYDKARVNFFSVTTIEGYDLEKAKDKARQFMREKPKLMWSVREIFGDYYWQDTKDIEGALNKAFRRVPKDFKNEKEIEAFISSEINKVIPLDQPQWIIWM